MLKNSVLYHRLWYVRKRTSKRVHIYLRLAVIFIILALLVSYANKKLMPCLVQISESKAKSMAIMAINNIVNETFSESVSYDDLTLLRRDKNGRITSIETNVVKLNRLSAKVTSRIQQSLTESGRDKVSIPFGSLLGNSIFAGTGPDLYIKIKHAGNIETNFRSEFISGGINQTRHRIYIQIRTKIRLIGPLTANESEIITDIPVAETIIVGEVPEIYLGIEK